MSRPDPRVFTRQEQMRLIALRVMLRRDPPGYSEWVVRCPDGRKVRMAYTPTIGPPTAGPGSARWR